MDKIDREILRILQDDARTSNAEIGRRVGLGASAIFQRIRKLEESGIVQGYTVRVNPSALGRALAAYVMIQTGERAHTVDTPARLAEIPEVQEVHRVVGEDCYFVKVRVRDPDALAHLLDNQIHALPSVVSTRTTIVLRTVKETLALPLEANARVAAAS